MFLFVNVNTHYLYQTKWFEVPLDHFGLGRKETFKIKYLENEDYWNKNEYGPIFFYTGNEVLCNELLLILINILRVLLMLLTSYSLYNLYIKYAIQVDIYLVSE